MKVAVLVPDRSKDTVFGMDFQGRDGSVYAHVPNLRRISKTERELVELPDGRAFRSMSRASVLLHSVGLSLKEAIAETVAVDPFSVGIYCALNNGPEDYLAAEKILQSGNEQGFAAEYRRLKNPKHYLKQLPNLAPAQLGIFLGAMGPTVTCTHSRFGSLHAIEAAQFDLSLGVVKQALICTAFSHEDALLSFRTRSQIPDTVTLSEGAAAIVVDKGFINFGLPTYEFMGSNDEHYGIANYLLQIALGGSLR
jgi:3-oxoacyl-(acyl-carrier-protein) synthase